VSSAIRPTLQAYLAGRVPAERVVATVAEEYYRETGDGKRETWQPLLDVIERAHPGIVQLAGSPGRPGFAIQLAERPFPTEYEPALKRAAEAILVTLGEEQQETGDERRQTGLVGRLLGSVRRLFSASA